MKKNVEIGIDAGSAMATVALSGRVKKIPVKWQTWPLSNLY